MANIKISELNPAKSAEILNLKDESEKGNSEGIIAFKTLRGGRTITPEWSPCQPPPGDLYGGA
ncbi:hypothetical protein IQ276_038100 [Desmonostoc muscorum LEGE 12446]|uniref:Uncharacterized protein n=1 Tax=Desmonostoc muscorum LEGE 12446 TaxID=1828758 RepID=A0A8J7DC36_DESMC|nr:hypothetical protein [Desmonostoc muscorum]MCF2152109.1 hypothetical protein [Desmonostoc muscorum LEGE 12446]